MKNMLLEEIVFHKKEEVDRLEQIFPLEALSDNLAGMEKPREFEQNLKDSAMAIIAEIKRASPVKGVLREHFDPLSLALAYERGGARAISVITEQRYFKGSPEYLGKAKQTTALPVLRKDFIITDYQVYESRYIGADAVLLIASLLGNNTLKRLLEIAASLGMEALVEVHDRYELCRALKAGARIIGINNRNLKTFRVNLSTTLELAGDVPAGVLLVSESGIYSREDLLMLAEAGVKAALIGETLIRSSNPDDKLRELLGRSEHNKVRPGFDHVD